MYSIDQLTNACQPVPLAGKVYPVRQLQLREWGELQAWLKSVCPSPVAVATKALAELRQQGAIVPSDVQDALFRQAQEESRRWPPKVGTAAWLAALEGIEEGGAKFTQAALKAGGTVVSDDEADKIYRSCGSDDFADLLRVCLHGESIIPKAQGESLPLQSSLTTGAKTLNGSATELAGTLSGSDV